MNSFFLIYPDQVEALNQFFMVKHQWFDSRYVTVPDPLSSGQLSTVERSTVNTRTASMI